MYRRYITIEVYAYHHVHLFFVGVGVERFNLPHN